MKAVNLLSSVAIRAARVTLVFFAGFALACFLGCQTTGSGKLLGSGGVKLPQFKAPKLAWPFKSEEQKLREQVERDPFPRADEPLPTQS